MNALHNRLHSVDLIGAHHHQLLLARDEHGVAADHLTQRAFGEELFGKAVEMSDLLVVLAGKLIDRQKPLISVKAELASVVVGEIPSVCAIADDKNLNKAQQRLPVPVARVALVIDNLLHGTAGADRHRLQLDLNGRYTIDQQDHVIAMVAVIGVNSKLIDDLERVLAPVPDVDESVVERRSVVALETAVAP